MAKGIKGITIEIGGDTTGLDAALKDVNKQASALQGELTQVERGLRFNPGNAELVAQQQLLLAERVQVTSQKLQQLRDAQAQVDAQFASGEINAEQYRAFNRELANTEGQLSGLQRRLQNIQEEQANVASSTQQMQRLFEATNTTLDDFADTLGTDLTNAIRNGRASSAQLEQAINQIGQQALGANVDLESMRATLNDVEGNNIDSVRGALNQLSAEANRVGGAFGTMSVEVRDALEDIATRTNNLGKELKEVDQLLKLDPNNLQLVLQKQDLLTQSIAETTNKLGQLRAQQAQVDAAFANGDMGADAYRAFQREIQQTEQALNGYQNQLNELTQEQAQVQSSTQQMQRFFEATETTVEDFADTLGTDLANAIRNGRATSAQLEQALNQMGQAALGSNADLEQLRTALRQIDDGGTLDQVRQDLADITRAAQQAGDEVNGFGNDLTSVIGGLAAGVGIAGIVEQALDVSSLNTDISISMNLNEADTATVRHAIMETTAAIGDEEAAYEGVRRQMTLNKDASAEMNAEIVKGAATIVRGYKEIDFKELVQESHEIGKELGISQQAALGIVNGLLDVGFPPEELDIIAEYGNQLKMAGYNSEQIQAIFAAGIDTGTFNIDILLDGLKEGRIVAAEFGQGVDKAMSEAIEGTNISAQQLEKWGQAVASGGQDGVTAMQEMNRALSLIDDDTKRNEIGVKMYGTLWEEQGGKISQTIQGMNEHIRTAAQNTDELNSDLSKLESDPAYQLAVAMGNIKLALAPVLEVIANLIAKIAEWVSNNAALFAAIIAIVGVIGILAGAFAALMPAIGGLVTAWPALVAGFGAISAPILIAVGVLVAFGAALVALWQNSETFRSGVTSIFENIKSVAVTVFETVASFIGEKIAQIKQFWTENGAQILQAADNLFSGVLSVIEFCMPAAQFIVESVWTAIQNIIDGAIKIITGAVQIFSGIFTGDFSKMWEGIKSIFSGAIDLIIGWLTLSFFGGIKTIFSNLLKSGVSIVKNLWDDVLKIFQTIGNSVRSFTDDALNKVVGFFRNFKTNVQKVMGDVKTKIEELWQKATDFLKSIDLAQIGRDVINGLIKGIGEKFGGVKKKIEALAALIPDWAKDILGIKSP